MRALSLDAEPLLMSYGSSRSNTNWRKLLLLLIISFVLATCLVFYVYLNFQVSYSKEKSSIKPLNRKRPILDHESMFQNSGPSLISFNDLFAHCIVALEVAGKEIVASSLLKNNHLSQISSKGKTKEGVDDIITDADVKSSEIITRTIKDSYRRIKVVSEEDHQDKIDTNQQNLLPIDRIQFAKLLSKHKLRLETSQNKHQDTLLPLNDILIWIDPLDATKEYSENLTDYVTLMACVVFKQTPIAGIIYKPFSKKNYWAIIDTANRGNSRHSLDLQELISGVSTFKGSEESLKIIVSRSHAGKVRDYIPDFIGNKKTKIIAAGGSGYKTIELLSSNANAYLHTTYIKKWDICAPHALINSVDGGNLTSLRGQSINFGDALDTVVRDGLIATINSTLHQVLIDDLKDVI